MRDAPEVWAWLRTRPFVVDRPARADPARPGPRRAGRRVRAPLARAVPGAAPGHPRPHRSPACAPRPGRTGSCSPSNCSTCTGTARSPPLPRPAGAGLRRGRAGPARRACRACSTDRAVRRPGQRGARRGVAGRAARRAQRRAYRARVSAGSRTTSSARAARRWRSATRSSGRCSTTSRGTAPARPGEQVDIGRFLGGRRGRTSATRTPSSPGRSRRSSSGATRPLAWSFVVAVDAGVLGAVLRLPRASARWSRSTSAGSRHVGYGIDWRRFPVDAWLDLMNEREHSGGTGPPPDVAAAPAAAGPGRASAPRSRRRCRPAPPGPARRQPARRRPRWAPTPAAVRATIEAAVDRPAATSPRASAPGRPAPHVRPRRARPRRPPPRCSACRSAPTAATWPRRSSSSPTCCGRWRSERYGCRPDRAAIEQRLTWRVSTCRATLHASVRAEVHGGTDHRFWAPASAACPRAMLLARDGHEVTVLERDPAAAAHRRRRRGRPGSGTASTSSACRTSCCRAGGAQMRAELPEVLAALDAAGAPAVNTLADAAGSRCAVRCAPATSGSTR